MHRCIYSRQEFEKSTAEHILQNFLGARRTFEEIVCDEVQAIFGKTIDLAFSNGLTQVRTLLGTRGGRGGEAPIIKGLKASSGEVVDLMPGG